MNWLLRSIGISEEMLEHPEQAAVVFLHPWWLLVGLVVLVPIGLWIWRRQRRSFGAVPHGLTVALTVTRILILALLVVVLAEPYLTLDYLHKKKPILAVLFDHSASMLLPAGPFTNEAEILRVAQAAGYQTPDHKVDAEIRKALNRISRAKLAQSVHQTALVGGTNDLADKFDVRWYAVATGLRPVPDPADAAPPHRGGAGTHLGDAISQVLDEAGGQEMAGILVFTDGQNTGGQPPAEVARRAATLGAPVFAVPCASAALAADAAVVDAFSAGHVALGDTVRVTAHIESQGLDGKTATVQLLDGTTVLDSKDLALRGGEQQELDLTFQATRPGARYLTVNLLPLAEETELLRANNTENTQLRVGREKVRVLYVDGLPRWDFRFLKNALRRDHGLGGRQTALPDVVLEAEARRWPPELVAAALPTSVEELATYHTIILGDASPKLLDPNFTRALSEAVRERGVGLVVMAGPQHMPQAFGETLTELLPVKLHPQAAGVPAPPLRPFRLEVTPQGLLHEVMRLDDQADRNESAWARMPPYYWCAAVERPMPAATVLASNRDVGGRYGNLPLIAWQFVGDGRVLFVGTDSTWLWRQNIGERYFYRFWGQAVRFVARRDGSNQPTSTLQVRPLRVEPGQPAEIELLAFDGEGRPRQDRTLAVRVLGGQSARTVTLTRDPALPGRFSGEFVTDTEGEYRVVYDPGSEVAFVESKFRVAAAAEELRRPNLNRATLEVLASGSGGQLIELTELSTVPGLLRGQSKLIPVHREASLWNNWLTVILLATIYSVDVGLRRLRGLA